MLDFLYAAGVALSVVGLLAGVVLTLTSLEEVRDWRWKRPATRRGLTENRATAALRTSDHPV